MRGSSARNMITNKNAKNRRIANDYHSVVLSIEGLENQYQFKLWQIESMPMCILLRDDCDVLQRLKVGDTISSEFYANGSTYPVDGMKTSICNIIKKKEGRFKGHCLVGLEIVREREFHH